MMGRGGTRKLTKDDALAYVMAVKDKFHKNKTKYNDFVHVMQDFEAQRIDTVRVLTRVKELFKGHRDLMLGVFKKLLRTANRIEQSPKPVYISRLFKISMSQRRFQSNDSVFESLKDIIDMYTNGNMSIPEVYKEVAALFQQHPDLLEEFTHFLSDSSAAASNQNLTPNRNSVVLVECGGYFFEPSEWLSLESLWHSRSSS